MPDKRTRDEKLVEMAAQTDSPAEAQIALEKVRPALTPNAVRKACEAYANGKKDALKTIRLAYLTDWPTFDTGWRQFIATRTPEDDAVMELRAEMGKLA